MQAVVVVLFIQVLQEQAQVVQVVAEQVEVALRQAQQEQLI